MASHARRSRRRSQRRGGGVDQRSTRSIKLLWLRPGHQQVPEEEEARLDQGVPGAKRDRRCTSSSLVRYENLRQECVCLLPSVVLHQTEQLLIHLPLPDYVKRSMISQQRWFERRDETRARLQPTTDTFLNKASTLLKSRHKINTVILGCSMLLAKQVGVSHIGTNARFDGSANLLCAGP